MSQLAPSPTRPRGNQLAQTHARLAGVLLLLVGTAAFTPTFGADKAAQAEAQARYKAEREACTSSQSNQDRGTCLKEAEAAYALARRGALEGASPQTTTGNQFKRCEPLPEADRKDCVARMQGEGTTTGSVAAGGISRELVTREPARPASAPGAK